MKKNLILIALSSMLLSTAIFADDVAMPVVKKPAVLLEGTQQSLTADQIAELLPWAKNSKSFLIDLISSTQGLSTDDKIERITDGIKQTVGESAPKNSELFMRYILNRSLVVVETLDAETNRDVVGSNDTKLRVLLTSAKLAIKYYDIDVNSLTNKTVMPFEAFGIDYFNFLNDLNKSIFDASAQYKIQRISLEWLQWDLYRSLNNATYAAQIVKLNNAIKLLPSKKLTDAQSIANIKQMKKVIELLDLPGIKNISERSSTDNQTVSKTDLRNTEYDKYQDGKSYYYSTSDEQCFPVSQSGSIMKSSRVNNNYCFDVGKYYYSSDREQCFKVSKDGNIMYSDRVDDKLCAKEETFYYSTSREQCFAFSTNDKIMYSSRMNDTYCAKKSSYYYSSDREKCYKVSSDGNIMYSSHIDDKFCAKKDYFYSTSREQCFPMSINDKIMYSSRLDDQMCAQEDKFYYSSDRAACYKVSSAGSIMYSSKVNDKYCTN
jgi:hypothetical protein